MIEGRRDRKKQDTRNALRCAALRLCLVHGYDNVTVEAITEAADVSVRTFFNYFGSKEDAVLGMDEGGAARVALAIAARPADEPPVAVLRAVFMELADDLADGLALRQERAEVVRANPQLWSRMIASFGKFEAGVAAAVAQRTGLDVERSVYPSVVAAAAAGAMRVALHPCHPAEVDAEGVRRRLGEAFDILAHGMARTGAETP